MTEGIEGSDEFVARIVKHGRITIPRNIRNVRGLEYGDYVKVVLVEKVESIMEAKK